MENYVLEPERKTPIRGEYDVIVVGGGPAGIGSAIASAINGAKTLLIERYGFLGGMFTAGLVVGLHTDKLYPVSKFNENKPLIGGLASKFLERLIQVGGAVDPSVYLKHTAMRSNYIPSDPEMLKIVAQDMLLESGVKILLHSLGTRAIMEDNKVKGIFIETKSGREALLSNIVIDSTGDGDVAASAGAEYELAAGKTLPMTLMVLLGNVNIEKAKNYPPKSEKWKELMALAMEQGFIKESILPERPVAPTFPIRFVSLPPKEMKKYWQRKNETYGWGANYFGDCTDVNELTKAEIETRKRMLPMIKFLKKNAPGYEECYLVATAPQVGTRESRRIIGEYMLTAKYDIEKGIKHEDNICRGRRNRGELIEDCDPPFDIPYRCLVPKNINGLVISGRCISIDHTAGLIIAIRDGIQTMGIGQAAGTAAAICSQNQIQPRDLVVNELQKILVSQGMNLTE
jgi:hypothetical protein